MKNVSLILSAVLLVAVGILYYLFYSRKPATDGSFSGSVPSDVKIAFVNSDSILKYYDYFKVNREKLEAKGKKLNQDFTNRAQSFQSDYEAYQRNQANLTIGQAKAVEEDLGKKQQNLQLYQQSLSQEISNDEAKLTQNLYLKVTGFLKKYAKDKGLQVVFKMDPSSDILFGGESLDITKEVIKELNLEFQSEKSSAAESKKDSLAAKKK